MAVVEDNLGHYRIVGEAGFGAMSTVYEALDTRIGRRVALKVVRPLPHTTFDQREEMFARLRREARAIARLSHPNVVTIYDVGEQQDRQFLVMEYLEGMTLRARLDQGPLLPDEAARILHQVAAGLDAIHAEGIVHRDLKPANVMLLPDGRVKLMDFGVARQQDDTMVTQAGMIVGSPAYMAPEQVEGGTVTTASDAWALGVLLYEMLAGHPPFPGKNIPTVLYQVAHEAPKPLPSASPRVQSVLARALDKNPQRRYESAHALADAFATAIDTPPATAPRLPRMPLRPDQPGRRRPALAGLALLLALGAVGGVSLRSYLPHVAPPSTASAPQPANSVRGVPENSHSSRPPSLVPTATTIGRRDAAVPQHLRRAARVTRRHTTTVASLPPRLPENLSVRRSARVAHASSKRAVRETPVTHRVVPPPRPRPVPRVQVARASSTDTIPAPKMLGTWHGWQGIHGHDPAVLTVTRQQGNTFGGVMTVNTPEHATVRVALEGHVLPGGRVAVRETRILSSSKPHAWDLGFKSGQITGGGMSGVDHDVRGRTAHWAFTR